MAAHAVERHGTVTGTERRVTVLKMMPKSLWLTNHGAYTGTKKNQVRYIKPSRYDSENDMP